MIWFRSKSDNPVDESLRAGIPFDILNALPVVKTIPSSKGNVLPIGVLKYP